jgi:hypothetical protein
MSEKGHEKEFFENKTMENLEKCSEKFFTERFGETDEFEEDLEKMAPCSLKTLPLYREETCLAICLRN